MKKILFFVALALIAPALRAQSTTVSATVQDVDAVVYGNGTVTANFVPAQNFPSATYVWSGGALSQTITGSLNSSGVFSVSIPSNGSISPAGSQWSFTACTFNGLSCANAIVTVVGSTQSISTQMQANAPLVIASGLFVPKSIGANGTTLTIWGSPNNSSPLIQVYDYLGNSLLKLTSAGALSCVSGCGGGGSFTAAGDLSGTSSSQTVIGINGTLLSGLATGILKNTTTTGVPSIATSSDILATCTTCVTSAAALTSNILTKGGGLQAAQNSSITDNGTTVSTAEALSVLSVATNSDGVHPSSVQLVGNTTLPSLTGNTVTLLGFPAATNTAWSFQFPTAIPTTNHILGCTVSGTNCLLSDLGAIPSAGGGVPFGPGAGSVNVMTVTTNTGTVTNATGQIVNVLTNLANTTTTPTLNADGAGAQTILKIGTSGTLVALAAGDYGATAGASYYTFISNGTNWILRNPQTPNVAGIVAPTLQSTVATGTAPFTVASTTPVANLNIPINGVSSATGAIPTIANGNNPLTLNCAQTTTSQSCVTFGETTAATQATDNELLVQTVATSRATVLKVVQTSSASGTASSPALSVTGGTGGAAGGASSAGNQGGGVTVAGGTGSAGGATSGTGGAGGDISFTTGTGGAATAGSTTGRGGNFSVTLGTAGGTGTPGAAGQLAITGGTVAYGADLLMSSVMPTVASGFGTGPTITGSSTASFAINVGTSTITNPGVLTMPAAAHGWSISCADVTTATSATLFLTKQTASSTTSVTITQFTTAALTTTPWTASDVLECHAFAN